MVLLQPGSPVLFGFEKPHRGTVLYVRLHLGRQFGQCHLVFPVPRRISGAGPLTRAGRPRPAGRGFKRPEWPARGPAADAGVRPTKLSGIGQFGTSTATLSYPFL